MSHSPFQDPRANDLLSRVSDDVAMLRQDIGQLFSHTTRHTLPMGARELADNAKSRLAAGRNYSAEQLRALRNRVGEPSTTAWVGGAVLVGLVAAGVFLLTRNGCCSAEFCDEEGYEGEDS